MKKSFFKSLFCFGILVSTSFTVNAQMLEPAAAPYWVVESNAATKNYSIVRFYSQQHQLLYEEKLEGVNLNISRNKVKRMLNKSLQQVAGNSLLASQRRSF